MNGGAARADKTGRGEEGKVTPKGPLPGLEGRW